MPAHVARDCLRNALHGSRRQRGAAGTTPESRSDKGAPPRRGFVYQPSLTIIWEILKLTAKDARNAKKRMEQKSFISSFIEKYNFIPFRSSRSSCPSRLKSIFRSSHLFMQGARGGHYPKNDRVFMRGAKQSGNGMTCLLQNH
jgi:hypothetical protein